MCLYCTAVCLGGARLTYDVITHVSSFIAHVCFKMEDVLSGKKKLEQLKVAELRDQLEQRGLSKAGIKLDLVKRLREVILLPKFFDGGVSVFRTSGDWHHAQCHLPYFCLVGYFERGFDAA